jgi:hypothetical protein
MEGNSLINFSICFLFALSKSIDIVIKKQIKCNFEWNKRVRSAATDHNNINATTTANSCIATDNDNAAVEAMSVVGGAIVV